VSAHLRPLITVREAAKLAGQSRWAFRRWLAARTQAKAEDGSPRYPELVQRSGKRTLVQVEALGAALGRSRLDLESLAIETSNRVDVLELRMDRLENRRTT